MKTRSVIAGAILGLSLLTACSTKDPCATLPPPTPAQIEASQVAEVEREVGRVECVVQDGRWVRETED